VRARPSLAKRIAPYLYLFSTVIFAGALALDPIGRFFVAPLIVLAVLVAGVFLTAIFVASDELRALAKNPAARVTHGLEHGCVASLIETGHAIYSGATTLHGSFSIVAGARVTAADVGHATRQAIRRFRAGDTQHAYSPHCGTSMLVGITMFSVIIVGCAIAAIAFGVGAGPAFMAAACLGVVAQMAWRPLGLLAQRMLTVSTRFSNARVGTITMEWADGRRVFVVPVSVTL
jgi:hypothetical protein